MDARIKSGHDKRSGGGDAFERSWEERVVASRSLPNHET
jgi:hypothetical protein